MFSDDLLYESDITCGVSYVYSVAQKIASGMIVIYCITLGSSQSEATTIWALSSYLDSPPSSVDGSIPISAKWEGLQGGIVISGWTPVPAPFRRWRWLLLARAGDTNFALKYEVFLFAAVDRDISPNHESTPWIFPFHTRLLQKGTNFIFMNVKSGLSNIIFEQKQRSFDTYPF